MAIGVLAILTMTAVFGIIIVDCLKQKKQPIKGR